MPLHVSALRGIKSYIIAEWKRILHDAEGKFEGRASGSIPQAAMVAKSAQLLMLQELAAMKNGRLSVTELDYALDLFHTICSTSVDSFSLLKQENLCPAIRKEVREIAIKAYAVGAATEEPET